MNPVSLPASILIADDDPAVLLLAQQALLGSEFTVTTVSDGKQALDTVMATPPDLVLLDIHMPGCNGLDVCRMLRSQSFGPWLPILLFTGSSDDSAVDKAFAAGATDFIPKPVNWQLLPHHIRYMLRASDAIRQQHQHLLLQRFSARLQALSGAHYYHLDDVMRDVLTRILELDAQAPFRYTGAAAYGNHHGRLRRVSVQGPDHYPFPEILPKEALPHQTSAYVQQFDFIVGGEVLAAVCLSYRPNQHHAPFRGALTALIQDKVQHLLLHVKTELDTQLTAEVFANSLEGIAITNTEGEIIKINRAFSQVTGYQEAEVLGLSLPRLKLGLENIYPEVARQLQQHGRWQGEIWSCRKNGEHYPEWLSLSTSYDAHHQAQHFIAVFMDISQQKAQEKRIHELAHYDTLTGLANQTLLRHQIEKALTTCQQHIGTAALLLMDLNRFKHINETLGHQIGDQLLKQVAERLKPWVRLGDTLARQGGDEFLLLITGLPADNATAIERATATAEQLLRTLDDPFQLNRQPIKVDAALGIALAPKDANTVDDLIKATDTAMYDAKASPHQQYAWFDPARAAAGYHRFNLESALRQAINHQDFSVVIQPQVSAGKHQLIGGECLLRWHHAEHGWISPVTFIPLAEETGLIDQLSQWLMRVVFQTLQDWRQRQLLHKDFRGLSINISPLHFRKSSFLTEFETALRDSGLSNWNLLELELTEGCLLNLDGDTLNSLALLRERGVRIAIDDFGTGFSSLSYLKNLPLDILKIDQSFVRACENDGKSLAIIQAIIAMAEGLGLETIAEGVETEQELQVLEFHRCDNFQGYFFAKPMSIAAFEQYLQSQA
ncbi:MAG: EAL domain-containing protein [Methylococcales bacterium]|nr:EAL domain-containing protein [Methylococcales bacterium]